jgi:hypothetical protein
LIEDANRQAATAISKTNLLNGPSVPDGVHAIVSAYSSTLSQLDVECQDVGASRDINACTDQ